MFREPPNSTPIDHLVFHYLPPIIHICLASPQIAYQIELLLDDAPAYAHEAMMNNNR